MNISLWVLFVWTRDEGNTEAAYRAGELALLHAWESVKGLAHEQTKTAQALLSAFSSTLDTYHRISVHFLSRMLPHIPKTHAMSDAVHPYCGLDVNLRLFDLVGRIAVRGIWVYWRMENEGQETGLANELTALASAIQTLVWNNPALLLPAKDDQAIDTSLVVLFQMMAGSNRESVMEWLYEIVHRASIAYQVGYAYPCTLSDYSELLEHQQNHDEDYRREVTRGSILFPMIALFAALHRAVDLYEMIQKAKEKHLGHCTFQLWYPDETSEERLYTNAAAHGAVLIDVPIEKPMDEFLHSVLAECGVLPYYQTLTAVSNGLWPIVLVACRHHRIPVPLNLLPRWDIQTSSPPTSRAP